MLWVIEAVDPLAESTDPLTLFPHKGLLSHGDFDPVKNSDSQETLESLITREIFVRAEPPRFIILLSLDQLVLIDRTKWNSKRFLRFDLNEIFSRRENSTLKAMAALIHRDSLVPETGLALLDTLDENAHKHAFGVSEDLKYALRESIELLGNEAVYHMMQVQREGVFKGRLDENQLSLECLRYMYRLLFLLFRNHVLQKVIRNMSLSREKKGNGNRRGRISYAQLGINHLGAVYEALLCYRGFFAEQDLYEVKPVKDNSDELGTAYFVEKENLDKYTEDEKRYDHETGQLVCHPRGKFIYRMAGRDREKSAFYYTPEVLTNCLVKYALKELLQDKCADEILNLKICEPAMGSAAFLNETVCCRVFAVWVCPGRKSPDFLGSAIGHRLSLTG